MRNNEPNRDKGYVRAGNIVCSLSDFEVSNIRILINRRSDILPYFFCKLSVPNVNTRNVRSAALQQYVREASRRSSDIDCGHIMHIYCIFIQNIRQFQCASANIWHRIRVTGNRIRFRENFTRRFRNDFSIHPDAALFYRTDRTDSAVVKMLLCKI